MEASCAESGDIVLLRVSILADQSSRQIPPLRKHQFSFIDFRIERRSDDRNRGGGNGQQGPVERAGNA